MKHYRLFLGFALMLSRAVSAGEASAPLQPLSVSLQQEWIGASESGYHVTVGAGTNQFTFGLPEGFRIDGYPGQGKLLLSKTRIGAGISFALIAPVTSAAGKGPDKLALLARHPRSRLVLEFDRPVLGRMCHAYDIEWTATQEIQEKSRILFVPTKAGMLEISFTCGVKQFQEGERGLNILLGTLQENTETKRETTRKPVPS